MSNISLKLSASKLGKSLESLSSKLEAELQQAVGDIANTAFASMQAQIQKINSDRNREEMKSALDFTDLGKGAFLISLNSELAKKLDSGYGPFDMKPGMLNSQSKVSSGSRKGQPWVQKSKEGKKYAFVPFDQSATVKKPTGDLMADIKALKAVNRQGRTQKLTSIFKDDFGKPLQGKVAVASSENKNLNQMTKFQHTNDKGKTFSVYMTWRVISENSTGWKHPGFKGYSIFKQVEDWVSQELDNIVKTLL